MRVLIAFVICLGARATHAQSAGAEAEALFQQGVALMDTGQFPEACAAFNGSQQRSPAIATLLNLATCREKNGQLATAWGAYIETERQTRGLTDPTSQTLHQIAQDRAAKLEPRLSRLTIDVPATARVPGLELTRDGQPIDTASWGRMLPVDGGRYTIVAHAPGYVPWKLDVDIDIERDAKTLAVPALHHIEVVVTPPPSKRVPLAYAGGAVVALGVGLGFELSARSTYDRYRTTRSDAQFDSANHKRQAAEGLAAVGIASAGIAAWLYLRNPTRERVTVVPTIGGIALAGSY